MTWCLSSCAFCEVGNIEIETVEYQSWNKAVHCSGKNHPGYPPSSCLLPPLQSQMSLESALHCSFSLIVPANEIDGFHALEQMNIFQSSSTLTISRIFHYWPVLAVLDFHGCTQPQVCFFLLASLCFGLFQVCLPLTSDTKCWLSLKGQPEAWSFLKLCTCPQKAHPKLLVF
jgi:hypothetical protein